MTVTNETLAELLLGTMQQADRFKMKLAAAGFEIVSKGAMAAPPPQSDKESVTVSRDSLRMWGDELGRLANLLYDAADRDGGLS